MKLSLILKVKIPSSDIYADALVDRLDFEVLSGKKWYLRNGYPMTHVYRFPELGSKGGYKNIQMHQLIMKGISTDKCCDHINGNKLDNRRNNLRIVTRAQNTWNRKSQLGSSSGYKGVSFFPWLKRMNRWLARITKSGKTIYLGYFREEKDAALAYNNKAREFFGEYARLNQL